MPISTAASFVVTAVTVLTAVTALTALHGGSGAMAAPPTATIRGDAPASAAVPLVRLRVRDAEGAAVPSEGFLIDGATGAPLSAQWAQSGDDGWVVVEEHDLVRASNGVGAPTRISGKHRMVMRGPFGWLVESVELGAATAQRDLVAPRSIELRVVLEAPAGTTIPSSLMPAVYTDATTPAAWQRNVQERAKLVRGAGDGTERAAAALSPFTLATLRRVELDDSAGDSAKPGEPSTEATQTFITTVPAGNHEIWLLVDHPGFLRAARIGPFRTGSGPIRATLPAPCELVVAVSPDQHWPHDYASVRVDQVVTLDELRRDFVIGALEADGQSADWTVKDLPPGMLRLEAFALANSPNPDGTSDAARGGQSVVASPRRMAVLTPVAAASTRIALRTWDEATARERLLKGDQTLSLRVVGADGGPIAGSPVRLAAWLPEFGREVVLHEGTLSAAGAIHASSLPTSDRAMLRLYLDGALTDELSLEADHGPSHSRTIKFAPTLGRPAPDISVTRLDSGQPISLASLRGKVVLLDFWASWCGPCQQPMAHNDELLRRRTDWRDNVVILGASIDNTIEQIRGHVARKGWTSVTQAFCGGATTAWKSKQVARYGIKGVPAAFLIDRAGVLRWAGHPGAVDIEREIDRLLAEPVAVR